MAETVKLDEKARQAAIAAIRERMGPLVGSPEYLADPVKRARAEKRQADAAEFYADIGIRVYLTAEAAALPEEANRLVDTIRRCNAMLNACGVTLSFNEHDPRIVQAFELLRDQTANAALAANLLERLSRVRGKEGGR